MTPDDVYTLLVDMHHGLTEAQSALVNARLILLLANALNDPRALADLISEARMGVDT